MDLVVVSLTITLVLSGTLSGVLSTCPSMWSEAKGSCVKSFDALRSWKSARVVCMNEGGDLVQIWNKEKNEMVRAARDNKSLLYWTGLTDYDGDGTFEFMNGTKLATSRLGLGEWGVPGDSYEKGSSQMCVLMAVQDTGWLSKDCNHLHRFLCEIVPSKQNTTDVLKMDVSATKCRQKECQCYRKDWYHLRNSKKFVVINAYAADFKSSTKFCGMLGGHLLKVTETTAQDILKEIMEWKPKGIFYWIGLSKSDSKNSKWTWVDGAKLEGGDYQNWVNNSDTHNGCAVVIWDYSAKWRVTYCDSEEYHICEAKIPCASFPFIDIGNGPERLEHNYEKTVVNEQEVVIKCFLFGYPKMVTEVKITCEGGHLKKIGVRERSVTKSLHVDVNMHGKECVCWSVSKDGTMEEAHITLNFITHPRLVNINDTDKIVEVIEGTQSVIVTVDIYANPKPVTYNLTKNGVEVPENGYLIQTTPLKKALHYSVRIILKKIYMDKEYILTIDNGIKDTMKYKFYLKGETHLAYNYSGLLTHPGVVSAVLIGCVLAVVAILVYRGSKKGLVEQKEREKVKDKDKEHESKIEPRIER